VKIAVVTVATSSYLPGARALFASLRSNTEIPENVSLICLAVDFSEDYILEALGVQIIQLPTINANIESSPDVKRYAFTLNKFEIFRILEKVEIDRIVYLDSDILCLKPIDELFYNLSKFPIYLAKDYGTKNLYREEIKRQDLDPRRLFNSGVMIINKSFLDYTNYQEILFLCSNILRSYDGGDQGYLNSLFKHKSIPVGQLNVKYNYTTSLFWPTKLRPPILLHFLGTKPWQDSNPASVDLYLFSLFKRIELLTSTGSSFKLSAYRSELKVEVLKDLEIEWLRRSIITLLPKFWKISRFRIGSVRANLVSPWRAQHSKS
jgi:lipopolysaccharide biosynthesis glycosyltransferase